jgi:hypothetical protein
MAKNRKSNKEAKKKPALTLMEKRAAKKNKDQDNIFLVNDSNARKSKTDTGTKRP